MPFRSVLFDNGRLATGGLDLSNGGLGEGVGLDLDGGGELTVTEDLDQFALGGETAADEGLDIELLQALALEERLQGGDVDALVLDTGGVLETELRETALDRHLAAFETDLVLVTGTGLGALGTTGGSAALTGTLSATDSLAIVRCALGGLHVFKFHLICDCPRK